MTETGKGGGRGAYRGGIGAAVLAAFLTVWTTIVRDDGSAMGYFMIILAAPVGWFAARFEPAGMARTMLGVAVMQVLAGMLVVTAPVTATEPDGIAKALLFNGGFTVLWLVSAGLFRAAAKRDRAAAAAA
jgi:hypothetical protein